MKIFIDIETIPVVTDNLVALFNQRYKDKPDYKYEEKAAFFAEFGKVVCVSVGRVQNEQIILKSFCSDNETQLLQDIAHVLQKATTLVAHNGKDFDYPFLCRRMIINQITLPKVLQIQNLKPWEMPLEDTVDMWKFGQFSHKVSLALMCELFNIPTPKADMDGSKVAEVFAAKDYDSLTKYCEGDVISLINVYRKLNYQPILLAK